LKLLDQSKLADIDLGSLKQELSTIGNIANTKTSDSC
jgi:hypothetical protein